MRVELLKTNLLKIISYCFVVGIILLIIVFTFLPKYTKIKELNREKKELNDKIAGLKRKNKELRRKSGSLKNNSFYLEKIAREELGAVKENEVSIHIKE